MSKSPADRNEQAGLSPEEAFALLGNTTRVGILQALWDQFESGPQTKSLPYSALFDAVEIVDSGNFSYHLEKLTGPFVRRTDTGYALKQTGINIVRAVVAGTVTTDPSFGPTPIDIDCPICTGPVEVAYDDELLTANCRECGGLLDWEDASGFLFGGLVPPAVMDRRPVEAAFRAGVTFVMYEIAALHAGVCSHCGSVPNRELDVCTDHRLGEGAHCPNCDRRHQSEAWMGCGTCKWSVFPPASVSVLTEPAVTAFLYDRGIEHRFATWEGIVRSFDIEEEPISQDPLRVRFRVPAQGDQCEVVVDEDMDVIDSPA